MPHPALPDDVARLVKNLFLHCSLTNHVNWQLAVRFVRLDQFGFMRITRRTNT